ncbi:MAG TPA: transposase [Lacunisphaera sp.]|nr:transposase [Lacunisphaera sp.]
MASSDVPRKNTRAPIPPRAPEPADRYFITLTTKDRKPWLGTARTRDVFLAVLRAWHGERKGRVLAASVMPDHAHVLIELTNRQTITQAINAWKSATLRGAGYLETFQREYQSHRLRETEDSEDYGVYMLLHPYRGRACLVGESWPGWWAPEPAAFRFSASLDKRGSPPQEWVDWPSAKFAALVLGD